MKRIIEVKKGIAMIVTDLHGNWEIYTKYRDHFFELFSEGKLSRLIFCGDIIHSEGPEKKDKSLDIILDIIELQEEYGDDIITMIMGNHELPHLYGIPLSKGAIDYTPRFEKFLYEAGSEIREKIIEFIDDLPFYIATKSGVMISHAGAEELAGMDKNIDILYDFSHKNLLKECDEILMEKDLKKMRAAYNRSSYDNLVKEMYHVFSPDDPRYNHLLRSQILYKTKKFELLWQTFFGQNEKAFHGSFAEHTYRVTLNRFLEGWSKKTYSPQNFLVAGHIRVMNGYEVICERLLRIASWAHSLPPQMGSYLLLDCEKQVNSMNELVACIHQIR